MDAAVWPERVPRGPREPVLGHCGASPMREAPAPPGLHLLMLLPEDSFFLELG